MTGVTIVGEVASTTAPVQTTAVMAVPLMEKALPARAVSKVLLVSVSVVALPISVSVAIGSVSVFAPSAPAGGARVMEPEVALAKARPPAEVPADYRQQ